MVYIIDRIKRKDGSVDERELRRKGQRVVIENLNVGESLVLQFLDDRSRSLVTTSVEAYNDDWESTGHLIVQTTNSIYSLRNEEKLEWPTSASTCAM